KLVTTPSIPHRLAMATPFQRPSMMRQHVACAAEGVRGRVRIRELGLLHEEHVRPGALEPPGDLLQARLQRVDVPGRDPHRSHCTAEGERRGLPGREGSPYSAGHGTHATTTDPLGAALPVRG